MALCPLELVPETAPPAWVAAARTASDQLAAANAPDCASVEVAVRPSGGALLTFMTTDGRRAVRALMSPSEIGPALDALLVTLPDPPASKPPSPAPAEPPPPAPEPQPSQAATASGAPATSAPPEAHVILGVGVGARFGFGGAFVTPAITLRPSGTFGHWELGGVVEFDPAYSYLPGGVPAGFKLWSFIAGLRVGRRDPIGPLALGYGLGVSTASIREEADDVDGTEKAVDFGQPRVAAYSHLVWPKQGPVRATFDLEVDLAISNFKRKASVRNDLPGLPRWGIVVALGAETSLL
ncbi:MAG: hypothetical protein JST00_18145 [Deltaproteobacteria bacterium]|nr:hypothetical protein [Deltaproteobacteria bacterium]